MRISLNHVNKTLVAALEARGAVAAIEENGLDIVIVRVWDGSRVAIHLIERDIDVPLIVGTLNDNTMHGLGTLFMLWSPMLLPEDGQRFRLYDWMYALLAVHGGLIYGFETRADKVYFYPVYFDDTPTAGYKIARFGETIRMRGLQCETATIRSAYISGSWRIADFEGFTNPDHVPNHDPQADPHTEPQTDPHADLSQIGYCYRVLGVANNAEWETVRVAYRVLARKFHPDLNPGAGQAAATAQMQVINIAYARLRQHFEDNHHANG